MPCDCIRPSRLGHVDCVADPAGDDADFAASFPMTPSWTKQDRIAIFLYSSIPTNLSKAKENILPSPQEGYRQLLAISLIQFDQFQPGVAVVNPPKSLSERDRMSAWSDGFTAAKASTPWQSPFVAGSKEDQIWREGFADGQGLRGAGYITAEHLPEDVLV
jgi:hypothetical protein